MCITRGITIYCYFISNTSCYHEVWTGRWEGDSGLKMISDSEPLLNYPFKRVKEMYEIGLQFFTIQSDRLIGNVSTFPSINSSSTLILASRHRKSNSEGGSIMKIFIEMWSFKPHTTFCRLCFRPTLNVRWNFEYQGPILHKKVSLANLWLATGVHFSIV